MNSVIRGCIFLVVCVLTGCGRDPNRPLPISGTVAFEGQPLSTASVGFFSGEEPSIRMAGAMVQAGRFNIPAESGLMPGKYLVRISAPESPANPGPDEMIGGYPINRERIPAEFNTRTNMTIEVKPEGGNHFDFVIP